MNRDFIFLISSNSIINNHKAIKDYQSKFKFHKYKLFNMLLFKKIKRAIILIYLYIKLLSFKKMYFIDQY